MVETLRPGVYFIEEPGQPVVAGVGTSEFGMFGVSERGPDDEAPIVTSYTQFVKYYGSFYQGNYAAYAAKAYFEQGGARMRFFRIVEPGETGTLQTGIVGSNNAIDWTSVYDGAVSIQMVNPGTPSAVLGLRFDSSKLIVDLATNAGTKASLMTGVVLSNNAIRWTAQQVGVGGNSITITLVDPGMNGSLSLGAVGTAITATLAYAGGAVTTTAAQLIDAVTNSGNPAYSAAVAALVTAANEPGSSGVGIVAAAGSAPLVGGLDPAITSTAAQVIALVSANTYAKLFATVANAPGSSGVGVVTAVATTQLTGSAGAVVARTPVLDLAGALCFPLEAYSKGQFGNFLSVSTLRASTVTTALLATSATSVTVADVTPFKLGDIVVISDGTTSVKVFVTNISASAKTLSFRAITLGTSIAVGASVLTSSSNRLSTKTAADLTNGATSVMLQSARAAVVGQRVIIDNGTNWVELKVTAVNGNEIQFDAVSLPATIGAGAVCASVEFLLKVIEDQDVKGVHYNLSMESTSPDYFMTRLSGDSNESDYWVKIGSDMATSSGYLRLPAPLEVAQNFKFGADGAAPSSTEVIGSDVIPRTGLYRVREFPSVNFIACPGFTAVAVAQAMVALCEENGRQLAMECLISAPLADDYPDEVMEFRQIDLNADTNTAGLYYPWLKVADPENANQILLLPPDAYMAGVWARVSRERGIQKSPANEVLNGVQGLTYSVSDGEHEMLNPISVNVIVNRPGLGIRIMGGRTLQSVQDDNLYISTRRTKDYIKRSLRQAMNFAVFEPNNEELWRRLTYAVSSFLFRLWQDGALMGASSSEAYYVKCDAETNPRSRQLVGEVHIEVGVAVTLPAEFVVFHLRSTGTENTVEEA